MAKTTVKTSRKGKTTSNSPIWVKKSITPLKGVTAGTGVEATGGKVAIRFLVGFMYLNVSKFVWNFETQKFSIFDVLILKKIKATKNFVFRCFENKVLI